MLSQHLNWQSIQVRQNGQESPKERWGHRLLKVKQQLFLFGGFGGVSEGQGKYLNDLWKFNLLSSTWQSVKTWGEHPQPRSNYTIHFNEVDNQILIFGGGSAKKVRYNTIFTLNLQTLHWRKISPVQNSSAPWERTYHTSQFLYPYLVVFGGQGVSYIDLNDTWIFDVRTQEWTRIIPQGKIPTKRRFASSALIGTDFYLIGGCHDNYHLIGDIHRLSLIPLINDRKQELKWQCLVQNEKLLQRWGHSCDALNGKLYMFAGRVNSTTDNSDFIQYDPVQNKLLKLQTQGLVPKPRRRHASVIVGNNLLCFGGYDGCYLKDFSYLKIEQEIQETHISIKKVKNNKELLKQLNKMEQQLGFFDEIEAKMKDKSTFVLTNAQKLTQNLFFKYLCKNQGLSVELPPFCSQTMFRIINIAITQRVILINQVEKFKYYSNLAESLSYFCCQQELKQFENFLISLLTQQNALSLLQLAVNSELTRLNKAAAITYLKNGSYSSKHLRFSRGQDSSQSHIKVENYNKIMLDKINDSLITAYQEQCFDIEQKRLRKRKEGLKNRAKNFFKELFSFKTVLKQDEINRQQLQKQQGYRKGILSYLKSSWAF